MSRPLAIVVAWGQHQVIGADGKMPWHISEDLKHFKRITLGHAVIMGRRTYESIGKPLPQRRNIVLTRNESFIAKGCDVAHNFDEALALAYTDDGEPRIIGGAQIYHRALRLTTSLHITRVDRSVKGDTFFPYVDFTSWALQSQRLGETPGVTFQRYERKR